MLTMKKIAFTALLLSSFVNSNAQKWTEMMQDPKANFYDIKKEFENYWKDKPYERGKGYKQFLRWAWMVEPRVYPTGKMENASRAKAWEEYQIFLKNNSGKYSVNAAPSSTTANWTPLGPYGSPVNGDAGRLQCVRFMPGNSSIIFVGTAAGGLWKSTNNGSTWTTNTDQLASLGVADIAIVPTNTNVMYLATGDIDAGDTKSIGVLKSTDGGNTWNATGLSWTTNQQRRIGKLLAHPTNANDIVAATSIGMYRSLDAGATWTLTMAGGFQDAEYKPGDPSTVYVTGGSGFAKSSDGGSSFVGVPVGFASTLNRLAIAVTPADPNYVYVIASKTDNSFGGLYKSNNSAASFTMQSNTPNILDWSDDGSGGGGQGWYDLAIGASPANKEEITIGGVNTWKSTDGGVNWFLNTHWYGGGGKPYVHADCHDIIYLSGTTCYAGTDGGISRTVTGGGTWTTINGTMNIAQQYRMGQSATSASLIIAGHQDNGSNRLSGTTWEEVNGGDGMDCFVDWSNDNVIITSIYYGDFYKSTDGGNNFNQITNGLTGNGAWVAPIIQNPVNPNIFYCGMQDVFRSTNKGNSWAQMGSLGGGGEVLYIAAAPSNTNTVYASRINSLYRTTNNGVTWGNITAGLPVSTNQITNIAVDNTNPNNVYITLSGYTAANKVFYSNNGGATWTNYSTGLPNIPVNCIVYKNNSPGAVYVGTDVGVYYRELSMSSWMPFMSGLPNVIVNDLEIHYASGKIRAATYGRGTWQSDLYSNPSAVPTAFFTNLYSAACLNVPFQFNDVSSNSPNSWSWSFPGGSPSSSAAQAPSVTFTSIGIYTVTLVATNTVGASSPYTTTISVVNSPTANAASDTICVGQSGSPTVTTNASLVTWQDGQTGIKPSYSPTTTTVYSYTASTGACQTVGSATIFATTPPPMPTISITGSVVTSSSAPLYQWYLNGSPISGANSQSYTVTTDGWYSVWVDNGFGCKSSSSPMFVGLSSIQEVSVFNSAEISPNPAHESISISLKTGYEKEISFEIRNTLGQTVKNGKYIPKNGEKFEMDLDGMPCGAYVLSLSTDKASAKYKFIRQ